MLTFAAILTVDFIFDSRKGYMSCGVAVEFLLQWIKGVASDFVRKPE